MISVIIPCYNAEKTIERTLRSLLEGQYQDLEVLISDDASSDGTRQICAALQDPRIRILASPENGGVSHARNLALKEARGEYVSFLDADDSVTPDYLESLAASAYENQADWVLGGFSVVDGNDPARVILESPLLFDEDCVFRGEALRALFPAKIFYNGGRTTAACVWGGLLKRSLIEENALRFDESLRYGEDMLFNLRFSAFCRSFAYVSKRLYRYHQYGGGSTDALFKRYTLASFIRLSEAIELSRQESGIPLLPEESNYICSQTFGFLNQNAFLAPPEARRAFLREFDAAYWASRPLAGLWQQMKRSDIAGAVQKLRFTLIKKRRYRALQLFQRLIRLVKK